MHMQIQCECGNFRAELTNFPKSTPGRLVCYCDDCQSYLHYLKRADLLDVHGGTEVIPNYPADVKIVAGKELVKCTRVKPDGMFRFSTTCCNTPIANTQPGRPWAGFHRRMFSKAVEDSLGPVKSSISGQVRQGHATTWNSADIRFQGNETCAPLCSKGNSSRKGQALTFLRKWRGDCAPEGVERR